MIKILRFVVIAAAVLAAIVAAIFVFMLVARPRPAAVFDETSAPADAAAGAASDMNTGERPTPASPDVDPTVLPKPPSPTAKADPK